jgi:NTP pyrophosphatase (non-canonical NTP hydrolase)
MFKEVADEMERAHDKYGPFFSTHEALGVIAEEYHELVEAIRSNKSFSIQAEAIQLAAACIRLASECEDPVSHFAKRSGL